MVIDIQSRQKEVGRRQTTSGDTWRP